VVTVYRCTPVAPPGAEHQPPPFLVPSGGAEHRCPRLSRPGRQHACPCPSHPMGPTPTHTPAHRRPGDLQRHHAAYVGLGSARPTTPWLPVARRRRTRTHSHTRPLAHSDTAPSRQAHTHHTRSIGSKEQLRRNPLYYVIPGLCLGHSGPFACWPHACQVLRTCSCDSVRWFPSSLQIARHCSIESTGCRTSFGNALSPRRQRAGGLIVSPVEAALREQPALWPGARPARRLPVLGPPAGRGVGQGGNGDVGLLGGLKRRWRAMHASFGVQREWTSIRTLADVARLC